MPSFKSKPTVLAWKKMIFFHILRAMLVQGVTEALAGESHPDLDLNFGLPGEEQGVDTLEVMGSSLGTFQPIVRKGTPLSAKLWPKTDGYPTIAYRLAGTQVPRDVITHALKHYEDRTCIRFESATWPLPGNKIAFRDGSGCSSVVGFESNLWWWLKGQPITLASGCSKISTVVHEIGHALGLYHEQSRSDRNAHVSVVYKNIASGAEGNFYEVNSKNFGTEYDFFSVLHYGPFAFSDNGQATLAPKDPMVKGLMLHGRAGLSHMDAMLVNKMYGCTDLWVSKCPEVSQDPCQNLGYLGPDCDCVCPEGTMGNLCQNKIKSYSQALMDKLLPKNEKFTSPGTISSDSARPGDIFTKLFTASACQRPHLTVLKFDMAPRASTGRCSYQGTEIGLEGTSSSGSVYCGTQLQVGQTLTSSSASLYVFYWHAVRESYPGFEFRVEFKAVPGCSVKNNEEVFAS